MSEGGLGTELREKRRKDGEYREQIMTMLLAVEPLPRARHWAKCCPCVRPLCPHPSSNLLLELPPLQGGNCAQKG